MMDISDTNPAVLAERHGAVLVLRLNEPRTMNALSASIKEALGKGIAEGMASRDVGCIVITGTGTVFCAGGDLTSMSNRVAGAVRDRLQETHHWVHQLLTGEKPVIAAVNGAAVGAGFSLALLCDIVLASDSAWFRGGFATVGAAPDLGIALGLPRAIGMNRAKDILMNNRKIGGQEAFDIGLAARCVPAEELEKVAMDMAAGLSAGPRTSLGLTKYLLNKAYDEPKSYLAAEAFAQAVAFGSSEFDEGIRAFQEKRKPDFDKGRKG